MSTNLFQTLTKWDIEFSIGPEMLKSIMEYLVSFKHEMYIKFFSDKMFMQSRSSDNTQYSEIDLSETGVQDYNANIPEGIENRYMTFTKDEKIANRNIYITTEGPHKRVFLNLVDKNSTTPMQELIMFMGKNNIKVKIDTLYEKKIEFTVQRGMYIWWRLMDPVNEDTKGVEIMPSVINKIRNDTSVEKAVLTMEPGLFKRLANIGGKPGSKSGNAHTRALFETDVNKGLTVASGDNLRGRVLKLGVLGGNIDSYDKLGNKKQSSDNFVTEIDKRQEQQFVTPDLEEVQTDDFDDIDSGNDTEENEEESGSDSFGSDSFGSDSSGDDNNDVSDLTEKDMFLDEISKIDGEVPFMTQDDISGRSKQEKQGKKDKKKSFGEDISISRNSEYGGYQKDEKKKSYKKKDDESIIDDAISNDLTSAEVAVKTQIWLEIPFLAPILKLNGLAPIMIEMRNGKPLVVIQKPFSDMTVLLTVAPRIETDDSD